MKKPLLLLLALFTLCGSVYAQDPHFSQFFANQPQLNPAFTGAANGPRASFNYRAQWVGIPKSFRTFAAGFDMPLRIGNTLNGLGVNFLTDQAGEGNYTTNYITVGYAFHIPFGDYAGLRLGISGGIEMNSINFFTLRFPDQIQKQLDGLPSGLSDEFLNGVPSDLRIREQVNFGAVFYNRFFFAGASANNLTMPLQEWALYNGGGTQITTRHDIRVTGFVGSKIPLRRNTSGDPDYKLAISPVFLMMWQNTALQLNFGTYFYLEPLMVGVWYRQSEQALIGMIGFSKGILQLGYSYDYDFDGIQTAIGNSASSGSHEVSLVLTFPGWDKKSKGPKVNMSCPKF